MSYFTEIDIHVLNVMRIIGIVNLEEKCQEKNIIPTWKKFREIVMKRHLMFIGIVVLLICVGILSGCTKQVNNSSNSEKNNK